MPIELRFSADTLPVVTAIQAAERDIEKNTKQAAVRAIGTLSHRSKSIFESNKERPQESGWRPEDRMTGRFGFGRRDADSKAFVGRVFTDDSKRLGFGFPDVAQADAKTNYVWRSLEFGLKGSKHEPTTISDLVGESFFPTKPMRLPNSFYFRPRFKGVEGGRSTGPGRSPDDVMHLGGPFKRTKRPKGIKGKHFIEQAWISSTPEITKRFEKAIVSAFDSFK